jgi:hypothetical protein
MLLSCLSCRHAGWLGRLLRRPAGPLFRGDQQVWVENALPPEDYTYENLAVSRRSKMWRALASRWGQPSARLHYQLATMTSIIKCTAGAERRSSFCDRCCL